jgi:serine/threonine protein phosphatase PrpC
VEALQSAFVAADLGLAAAPHIETRRSGATCTTVVLERGRLAVACVGDCRCVLGKVDGEGDPMALTYPFVMTRDHRPELRDERERVEAAGARIDSIRARDGSARGPLRVWQQEGEAPGLMVTRSLGDGLASSLGVIAVPEVFVVPLDRHSRFLVVASDGVWDMLSNEEVTCIVKRLTHDPEEACRLLVAEAEAKWQATIGRADNITVGVLVFDTCSAYS